MPQGLGLYSPSDLVQGAIGQPNDVKGIDHLVSPWERDVIDRGIGGGHVKCPIGDAMPPCLWLGTDPLRHVSGVPSRQDIDDLVMSNVADRGGIAGVATIHPDEARLIKSNGRGLVETSLVGLQQCLPIGAHRIGDGVPVTGEFPCDLRDGSSLSNLFGGPLGCSSGKQASLCCNAVIGQRPRSFVARLIGTDHPVLLPAKDHRSPKDGEIDVINDGTLFDVSSGSAACT